MATEEARVRMSADDADVDAAWKRQFANMQRTEQQLKQMGGAVTKVGKSGQESFGQMAAGALGLTDPLSTVVSLLKQAAQAQAAWNKEREGSALDRAKSERAFDVATRGRGDKAAVEAAAQAFGVDEGEAWKIAAKLADAGVAPQDLPGVVQMQILAGEGADVSKLLTKLRGATHGATGRRGLRRLGIGQDEAASMPAGELLQLASQRLQALEDKERIAAAVDLFGKEGAGEQVGALMRLGPEDARRFQEADATKHGVVVAKDDTTQRDMDRATARQLLVNKANQGLWPAAQGATAEKAFDYTSMVGVSPEYAHLAGDYASGTIVATLIRMFSKIRVDIDSPAGRVKGTAHPAQGLGAQ